MGGRPSPRGQGRPLRGSPLCCLLRPDVEAPLMDEQHRADASHDRKAHFSEPDASTTDRAGPESVAHCASDLAYTGARQNPTVHQCTDALAYARLDRPRGPRLPIFGPAGAHVLHPIERQIGAPGFPLGRSTAWPAGRIPMAVNVHMRLHHCASGALGTAHLHSR